MSCSISCACSFDFVTKKISNLFKVEENTILHLPAFRIRLPWGREHFVFSCNEENVRPNISCLWAKKVFCDFLCLVQISRQCRNHSQCWECLLIHWYQRFTDLAWTPYLCAMKTCNFFKFPPLWFLHCLDYHSREGYLFEKNYRRLWDFKST